MLKGIACAKYTSEGKRTNNEDNFSVVINEDNHLSLVADGLGGHLNGEVASQIAVDIIAGSLQKKPFNSVSLMQAISDANDAIRNADISGHTTIAALWICKNKAVAAHVGDTRIYQFRNGEIIYQTMDHSIIQLSVMMGEADSNDVRHHHDRNSLFRVLGEEQNELVIDITELSVQPGDRFLLCSDGFWEPVTEADMLRSAAQSSGAKEWLSYMQQIVYDAADPNQDNHTAIAIIVA